jgi:ornithine decarboxylase
MLTMEQINSHTASYINSSSHQTPYMVANLSIVRDRSLEFKQHLPTVGIFYAYKALNSSEVIESIDNLVSGYDVASITEINELLALGVDPRRLQYSNPVKSSEAIAAAYNSGVRIYAFQSSQELQKLHQHAPGSQLFLRIAVHDTEGSLGFSTKFGCDSHDATKLLNEAHTLGFNELGITYHIGSQSTDDESWNNALKTCKSIINELKKRDIEISSINLGGGFPANYVDSTSSSIEQTAAHITEAITEHGLRDIKFVAEPGRYLVADSSVLVTSVIGTETRSNHNWLYLDVGAFQAFFERFEFGYFPYPIYTDARTSSSDIFKSKIYTLTGPTCDSFDLLTEDALLPAEMSVGDKLLIDKVGAYTTVYGSNFNGFAVPKIHYIDGSSELSNNGHSN